LLESELKATGGWLKKKKLDEVTQINFQSQSKSNEVSSLER